MKDKMRDPRVFTINPGAAFLPEFCRAFLAGKIVPGFPASHDALELARAKIYVPTRRAARALASEFQRQVKQPVVLLPTIVTLGHFESIESGLMFSEEAGFIADIPEAVSEVDRIAALMVEILSWADYMRAQALSHDALIDVSNYLAMSPTQAWMLAKDLAALMDEMTIEGIDWNAIHSLVPDEFDKYWSVTLKFLQIAFDHWPNWLREHNKIDGVERQRRLVELEVKRLAEDADAPLVAIGSTGTNRATAQLLTAIAHAPMGAVVLPGLDQELDDESWSLIAGDGEGIAPSATHPQAALFRLIKTFDIQRADVVGIGDMVPVMQQRLRLMSEALRPADTTHHWRDFVKSTSEQTRSDALAGVSYVEAADEREEALCIALRLRQALETPGQTAALVTPDRELSMRVKAELARWNIEIDDSGGDAFAASKLGQLSRLLLDAALDPSSLGLLPLLSHPLAQFGHERARVERLTHAYEVGVLRTILPDNVDVARTIALARQQAKDWRAHLAQRRIVDSEWDELQTLLLAVEQAFVPFVHVAAPAPLSAWIEAHRACLSAAMSSQEEGGEDASVLARLFVELELSSAGPLVLSALDYVAFFDVVTRDLRLRGPRRAHPRLKILGLLEARLLHVDVAILGGLDEGIWPPQSSTDAFLNRPMRAQLGLSPPERRIGQTAHDFAQLMGTPVVVLTRALKRGGAPTVSSRFLQRLAAVVGKDIWAQCGKRAQDLVGWARQIDEIATKPKAIGRPMPCPPIELRPTRLSVTRIETLRRDPYAIYAERILKLRPLDALGVEAGAREAGTQIHQAISTFTHQRNAASQALPAQQLIDIARECLKLQLMNASFRTFQWPRHIRGLIEFVSWDNARRTTIQNIYVEVDGALTIPLNDGTNFILSCQADRIELVDGELKIIDFKTGSPPSQKQVKSGFAPQLTLEAAMVEKGAFTDIVAQHVAAALYVKLGGADGLKETNIPGKDANLDDLIVDHFDGLVVLLNQFREPDMTYMPRPYPQFENRFSDYDHLSRVKEWSAGTQEQGA